MRLLPLEPELSAVKNLLRNSEIQGAIPESFANDAAATVTAMDEIGKHPDKTDWDWDVTASGNVIYKRKEEDLKAKPYVREVEIGTKFYYLPESRRAND
jgi:hypothetical protein